MRSLAFFALGFGLLQAAAQAQTTNVAAPAGTSNRDADGGVISTTRPATTPEYAPLTASERWRLYLLGAYGPQAILNAAAVGGIAQLEDHPKEWGGGALAFGERVGNSYAEHIVRQTLESGAAAILREDNRYVRSTETGFWKRTRHAVGEVFVARNDLGQQHFAYSRFAGAAGASFISRIWQPRSENSPGDATVNFGLTIAGYAGWNVFNEFRPAHFMRRR